MSETTLYPMRTQGYDLQVPGPGSVEAYDQKAGKAGACLTDAVENEIFRGTIPAFWKKAIPEVEKAFNLTRGVDADATAKAKARAKTEEAAAKVKDVPEKFSSFISRVEASIDEQAGDDKELAKSEHARLYDLLKSVALTCEIDPSPSNRERGPGAALLQKADEILSRPTELLEAAVSKVETGTNLVVDRDADGKPERVSLANVIKAFYESQL